MNKKPIESEYFKEMNQVRMFILLENSPQSNKYGTLLLTKDQYSKISNFIFETIHTEDGLLIDDTVIVLPNVQDTVEFE